jgi:hypothetical protein
MIQPGNREAAFEGHHIKSKMCLALTLTSIIPLLILTYTLHIHVVPLLSRNEVDRWVVAKVQDDLDSFLLQEWLASIGYWLEWRVVPSESEE